MRTRRRVALVAGALLVVLVAAGLYALPEIVRQVAVSRIHSMTGRPAAIDGVALNIFTGQIVARGFRLAERDGEAPFVDFHRLAVRVHLPALLRGHFWIRELVLESPVVRVVRLPEGAFNFSDLVRGSAGNGGPIDLTVDRFSLTGGTITLEDRALSTPHTWRSEQIAVEARNVSTRGDAGQATASSVTEGAQVSIDLKRFRLYPIHLEATVNTDGLDLSLARLYFPPGAPVMLDRGRASTSVTVEMDHREGLRAQATGHFRDIAVMRSDGRTPLAVAPEIRVDLAGFAFAEGGHLRVERLTVAGTVGVPDPRVKHANRMQFSTVRAKVGDLTWPATTDGRLDLHASIPDGGVLSVTGSLRPAPAPSQLQARVANLDLAPWTGLLPLTARISGIAEADLRMNEPLAAGVPARVRGSIAVKRLGVADARHELVRAHRVEASGIEVRWPERLVVGRVLLTEPHGLVERDRNGAFPLRALAGAPAPLAANGGRPGMPPGDPGNPAARATAAADTSAKAAAPGLRVQVGEVVVRGGSLAWRDDTVTPAARLDIADIEATVTGAKWPREGPLGLRLALRPPGGGRVQVSGRVNVDPVAADLRIVAEGAQLAPYQVYLPMPARVSGATDADVAVVLPDLGVGRATVRGSVGLSRVDVRDGQRTMVRVERAVATGLDVDWPRRVGVDRLSLSAPWMLIERDDKGAFPLRALLATRSAAPTAASVNGAAPNGAVRASAPANGPGGDKLEGAPVLSIARLIMDEGGLRVVDRSIAPPFGVDLQRLALDVTGLSTAPARPAQVHLTGRIGPVTELTLRGTTGPVGAPLKIDMNGSLRQFGLPRVNPYVQRQMAWQVREGWLTTGLRVRVDGEVLAAKTDLRVSQLQVARAGNADEAKTRIGLPLGMIVALMKDRRGDITLSFPVGGRLSDPKFDFREAIWGAVRTVAINAITLPVSWVGRVHMSGDSRIERIDLDPVAFQPGTATPTPEGQGQLSRLAAFMEQLPEVRMSLTPAVSTRDRVELGRRALDAAIDGLARQEQLIREAAVRRLFEQRFPGQSAPASLEATWAVLAEGEPKAAAALPELAERRVQVVRTGLKRAGIDLDRLTASQLVERPGSGNQIELEVLEPPEAPKSSPLRDFFRRLPAPFNRS